MPGRPHRRREPTPAVPPELRDHPQYEVLRELGRGGMGVVYLARNKLMDRPEVLKVVNKAPARPARRRPSASCREIRSAARLSHPNIVTAYSGLAGWAICWCSPWSMSRARTWPRWSRRSGPLPVANACYYAQQAALGLQHAFEQGHGPPRHQAAEPDPGPARARSTSSRCSTSAWPRRRARGSRTTAA